MDVTMHEFATALKTLARLAVERRETHVPQDPRTALAIAIAHYINVPTSAAVLERGLLHAEHDSAVELDIPPWA